MTLGINGLGRMGRTILRQALRRGYEIKLLNDIAAWDLLAYLIAFDSTHGSLMEEFDYRLCIEGEEKFLVFSHKEGEDIKIRLSNSPSPASIDCDGLDVMIEASGKFLDSKSLACYLEAGAKKVILSAPPIDDTPTFVLGVNAKDYKGEKIISNASCTTNCIAPLCHILDKHYGIEVALMTTVHSYTNDQNLLDYAHHSDKRRSRAAPTNIIPTSTGAAIGLKRVLPNMAGRIQGQSLRVPVMDVSMADLSFYLKEEVDLDSIHALLESYAQGSMKGILSLDTRERVSSDFLGSSYSSIVALDLSLKVGRLIKLMAWYDNETGYANRILDLAELVCKAD